MPLYKNSKTVFDLYLKGGGEMGQLIRSFDWSETSLGEPENWSQSLLTSLSILLNSRFAMCLWWGPDLILFYNDAYRPVLGANGKHPMVLGSKGAETCSKDWPVIQPLIDQVMDKGEATFNEDLLVPVYRNGKLEELYMTLSCSPVFDGAQKPAGIFIVGTETTEQVNNRQKVEENSEKLVILNEELNLSNKELKVINKAFGLSEASIRFMITDAPVAIGVLKGRELIIESANDKILEVWGKNKSIVGKSLFIAMPELHGQPFFQIMDEVYTSGQAFHGNELKAVVEQEGQLKDIYFNFIYHPVHDVAGVVNSIMIVATDVTEQVKARKAVEESEEKLRLAIESAELGTWTVNMETLEFIPSPRLKELFGFHPEEEMSFKAAVNQISEEYRDEVNSTVNEAIITGNTYQLEYTIIGLRDQKLRWVRTTGQLYPAQMDLPAHFSGTMMDITERKTVEQRKDESLKENKDLLESIFHSSIFGILVYKSVRNEAGKIIDFEFLLVSKLSEEFLGVNNLVGQRVLDLFPAVKDTGLFKRYTNVVEENIQLDFTEEIKKRDGKPSWFRRKSVKLGDGLVTSWIEVTEQKQTEIKIKESNEILQSVFDTSLIGMSLLQAVRDEKGHIKDFRIKLYNKELGRLSGRADLQNKLYSNEFPGVKKTPLFSLMLKIMETGKPEHLEYYYPYEGLNKWFSSMFVKMGDGLMATNLDITVRKEAELEKFKVLNVLQQSEKVAQMGSWSYELDTNVLTWSDGMYQLFNLENFKGVKPEIYLQYVTAESSLAAARSVTQMKTGTADFEEILEISVGGSIRILKHKGTAVQVEGKVLRVIGADVDITEQVELQKEKSEWESLQKKMEASQNQKIFEITMETQEQERKRIAESLHNGLGQLLYGVKLSLGQLNYSDEDADIAFLMETKYATDQLLTKCIKECRRISHELTPTILEDFGLEVAINDVIEQFAQSLWIKKEFIGLNGRLVNYMEITIYRTIQELLMNIIKHAHATEAFVKIEIKNDEVNLMVQDNGIGFSNLDKSNGIGLKTIQNKLKLLNGQFDLTSQRGENTITIRIPYLSK